jgi:hypothetical protein
MTVIAERFDSRTPAGATFAHQHHYFDFVVTFNPEAILGIVDNIGSANAFLSLSGIGNVIIGDTTAVADVSIHGGNGLSTVVLGNGDDHVALQGAFNTIVLGDGNDVVNAGLATGSAVFHRGEVHVTYQDYLSATFAAPLDVKGLHSTSGNHLDIGVFNSGTGNIGAFNGWGTATRATATTTSAYSTAMPMAAR